MATVSMEKDLSAHGLEPSGEVFWNLCTAELVEEAVRRNEGSLTSDGSFVGITTPHTGRSPNDKFTVREPSTEGDIWWGSVNVALDPEHFDALREDVLEHLGDGKDLFVRDVWCGADPAYRVPVRVISPNAWHSLFVHNMFREPEPGELAEFDPGFTVLHAPEIQADPERHGTRSGTFIVVNFAERQVLIGGTRYAGEIKKSVFSLMHYLLPKQGVLSMHCSANEGDDGDVALFFGLSGTGKTTLSTDPNRKLIGDDEHGWSDTGVFNFEGGNYAKVIRLSREGEPLIWSASRRFGAILENVVVDPATRAVDFDSDELTENTRSSYPLSFIEGAVPSGMAGHPSHVVFLTADAYGVLPPIAKLTREQAMYHFLSGYTAKVAGTERGVTEPKATFSACFGAPFLPLPPSVYARMLGRKIEEHRARVWLVNTGWTGGCYGEGQRMDLAHTRSMVEAILSGALDDAETRPDPVFGLRIPTALPNVPAEVLDPRGTWGDPDAYDAQAAILAGMFRENFTKFEKDVSDAVKQAGPTG
ncbi:MAG TPA: phosphoenolpyruvate carboxykinase (ATP) [Longimicrobiales bacterium]|nr:phosphoenolpyruvate carboxykinase (ATP) [Longimicrobiales bacterium]